MNLNKKKSAFTKDNTVVLSQLAVDNEKKPFIPVKDQIREWLTIRNNVTLKPRAPAKLLVLTESLPSIVARLQANNYIPIVHYFSNNIKIGGDYMVGGKSMECEMCRLIPGLYKTLQLERDHYPYNWSEEVLYIDSLQMMCEQNYNETAPINMKIITSAFNETGDVTLIYNMFKTIVTAPLLYNNSNKKLALIMSVYEIPEVSRDVVKVSNILLNVLNEYSGYYHSVILLVPNTRSLIYNTFNQLMQNKKL